MHTHLGYQPEARIVIGGTRVYLIRMFLTWYPQISEISILDSDVYLGSTSDMYMY